MELKKCPFCGGEAEFRTNLIDVTGGWRTVVYVWCPTCEARSHRVFYTAESDKIEAAERWNRREPMDKVVEQLEEQKDKHEKLGIEASKLCTFERLEARPIVFDEKMCHENAVEVLDKAIEIVKGGAV